MPAPEPSGDKLPTVNTAALFEPLQAALLQAPEPERYRRLASLLAELAGRLEARGNGQENERAEALAKKAARLAEERALLDDDLAAAKDALASRVEQLETLQRHNRELERRFTEQSARVQAAQRQVADLDEQLTAKNARLYEVENQAERLQREAQRAKTAGDDSERVRTLEETRRTLVAQVEELRTANEKLRLDKDAEIERLRNDLLAAQASSGQGSEAALTDLWERLARTKPPLAPGGLRPTAKAAERLFDAFIELARFVHDCDQTLRPFLGSFTRHNPAVARPWDVYARAPDLLETIRGIIDIERGQSAGVLKMRLLGLKRWTVSATIGSDSALESISYELEQHLHGPLGLETDPNRKVKDYLRADGPQLFHQRIRELRSQKLADAYAQGV